jgi:hypothetical protein
MANRASEAEKKWLDFIARKNSVLLPVLLWILVLLCLFAFLNTQAMHEMSTWVRWATLAQAIDPVYAYHNEPNAYPPGTVSVLFMALSATPGLDPELSIKLLLALFSALVSCSLGYWLKSWAIAYFSLIFFWVSSVMLGHLDVLYALPLVFSLWALSRKSWMAASFFFGVSTLLKWQPVIILPFIGIYLLYEVLGCEGGRARLLLVAQIVLPFIIVYLITFQVFGFSYLLSSVSGATQQDMLSGNALNLGWVLTFFVTDSPDDMVASGYTYVDGAPDWMPILLRLLFVSTYLFLTFLFVRSSKSFISLLIFSQAGVLAYVLFAAGVHQNHLTLAVPLAFILGSLVRPLTYQSGVVVAMAFFNLVVFYGFNGQPLAPMPEVGGIDFTVWLAIVYVGLGLLVVTSSVSYALNGGISHDQKSLSEEAAEKVKEINL